MTQVKLPIPPSREYFLKLASSKFLMAVTFSLNESSQAYNFITCNYTQYLILIVHSHNFYFKTATFCNNHFYFYSEH